jgi:CBS domain-containing protein
VNELTVSALMVPDPVTLAPTDTLRFAAGVLSSIGAGGAPVMNGDRVVGVVTMTDILEFAADSPAEHSRLPPALGASPAGGSTHEGGPMAVPEGPDWDVLDEHTVAEVMSFRVLSVPPSAGARDVARVMESEDVHRVLVMEGDALVGIVTALDLVRAVARGDLVPRDPGPS